MDIHKVQLWHAVIVLLAGGILASVLFPVGFCRPPSPRTRSLINAKQISIGALMYSDDCDARWMLAGNWCDALQPYTKSYDLFQDPMALPFGYAMNSALSGTNTKAMKAPEDLVLVYSSKQAKLNASGGQGDLRITEDRSTLGFGDGSARLVPRKMLSTVVWDPLSLERR